MSLFPAYSQDDAETCLEIQLKHGAELSPAREATLLASDEESPARAPPSPPPPPSFRDDFYLDPKSDYGNLRVSTLYYPGRPQYASLAASLALGRAAGPERRKRKRRYWELRGPEPPALDDELAPRVAAFRAMLADAPTDVQLWLDFIRFQEQCSGPGAALEVATDACARASHAALRRERHRLARAQLPAHQYITALRDSIAAEKSVCRRAELWLFLLEALAASPAPPALAAAAAAAARDTAAHPHAYPHILHAYGSFLRAAGLWELLVLLMELVATMSLPPSDAFPPPADDETAAAAEQRLLRIEDEVCASGLPLAARWVRMERARATAHWRAPKDASAQDLQADPQRAPLAADVTDLLLPVAGSDAAFLLVTQLLRLAKVPMLPGGEYVRRAFSCGAAEAVDDCAEALLCVTRAARRLPPAHPARAPRAARLLALLADPPHYLHREAGFLAWVQALWAAGCAWVTGERRVALLCWRLRWMHSLALLLDTEEKHGKEEMRRIRSEARSLVRAAGCASPLPFAALARLERAAAGPAAAAAAAAARAARAALRDPDLPQEQRLYVARVAAELATEQGPGLWPMVCAVLGRELPADAELRAAPPAALLRLALGAVEQRCQQLEDEYATSKEDDEISGGARVLAALLPGAGEWAAARALLASPAERHRLLQCAAAAPPDPAQSWAAARYREQAACALAAHRPAGPARRLAARYPGNALLALVASGGSAWAAGGPLAGADACALRRSEPGALAELLPPLLRAVRAWESGSSAEAAVASRVALRTSRRVARAGGGGATAWAALIESAARADSAALTPLHALLAATDAFPAHKWLYLRGAAWGGGAGGGAAAADAALDRQLRLHALPDELSGAGQP